MTRHSKARKWLNRVSCGRLSSLPRKSASSHTMESRDYPLHKYDLDTILAVLEARQPHGATLRLLKDLLEQGRIQSVTGNMSISVNGMHRLSKRSEIGHILISIAILEDISNTTTTP